MPKGKPDDTCVKVMINVGPNTPNGRIYAPCRIVALNKYGRICKDRVPGNTTEIDLVPESDWEWPSVASTFGWSPSMVQKSSNTQCQHESTDGTVKCKECGMVPGDFISHAYDYLQSHDGAMANDPGYFDGGN